MTQFATCPACDGAGFYGNAEDCATCDGTGFRKIDRAAIDLAVGAKEWIDEYVSEVFADYRKAFGIRMGGIDKWFLDGEMLDIDQKDYYDRGSDNYRLPVTYFYTSGEERKRLMAADAKATNEKKAKAALEQKHRALRSLEAQAEKLRRELE